MAEDSTMASPSPERVTFDPKKLGRLELARRSMSMDDDAKKRWNVSPAPDLGVHRSLSVDAPVSSSRLDISSLRTLAGSPKKRESSIAGTTEGAAKVSNERTYVPGASSVEPHRQRDGPMKSDVSHRVSTRLKQSSIRNGVGEEAMVALSKLAQRQSGVVAPAIILPSNRPFLVGENANRLLQTETEPTSQQSETIFQSDGSMNPSSSVDRASSPAEPNITILSKLLFFGGTTPTAKVMPLSSQTTPDAMQLSPDGTMTSQSDSCNSRNAEPSYLLQLGHIMGAPVIPRTPLQAKPKYMDENSCEVSSLEHYSSVAPERDCTAPQPSYHRFLRFLFLAAFISISTTIITFGAIEHINDLYKRAEQSMALTAREAYSIVLHRAEAVTIEIREVVHSKTTEKLTFYIDVEQTILILEKWQQLMVDAYVTAKGFIEDQAIPPEQIIRTHNQGTKRFLWTSDDEISTAVLTLKPMVILPKTMKRQEGRKISSGSGEPADMTETLPNHTNRSDVEKNGEVQLLEMISAAQEDEMGENLTDEPLLLLSDSMAGSDPSSEKAVHDSAPLTPPPVHNVIEETTSLPSKEKLPEVRTEQVISADTAKNRLQAAAKEELMQAMGKQVTSLLGLPRSSSFTLSLMAQAALRPHSDDTIIKRVSSVPLSSRKIIEAEAGLRGTSFDEIFSCPQAGEFPHRFGTSVVRSICRATEVSAVEKVFEPDVDILAATEDEDEFLQKPLVEIFVDFFRERRKRKELKRKTRRRKSV